MYGDVNTNTFIQTVTSWLKASNISFRSIDGEKITKFVIQHDLGKKWSIHFLSLVSSLLEELNCKTTAIISDEHVVSFEIPTQ